MRHSDKRSGMTLVELLVVLSILTLLAALVTAGVAAVRARQQARNTEDVVVKLQMGIDNQVKALTDQARADRRNRTNDYQRLVAYCVGDEDRAEALLMYLKLRHAFPQTYAEATTPVTIAGSGVSWPVHKVYATIPNLSTWSADEQSAALLYVGLSGLGTGGSQFATDDATTSAQIDWTAQGSNVSARVFKDAWNRPIMFKRFWQSLELDDKDPNVTTVKYTNAKTGLLDPFDTQGKLAKVTGTTPGTWTQILKDAAAQAVFVAGNNQTFDNSNKVLTAFSIGENKTFNSLVGDDIAGFRLRKLGGRGTQ